MSVTLTYSDLQSVFMEARADLERMLRRRLGSPHAAADLTQDIYLRLRRITAPLPDRHQARAYLFRMAVNLVTDHMRVERRRREILTGAAVSEVASRDALVDPDSIQPFADYARTRTQPDRV